MLNSMPVILIIGTILGFLSGLGIGGGSLLILWLTIVLGMPHTVARGINLLFFLPSALIACLFRWKQGDLRFRKILPAVTSGCFAACLFSYIHTAVSLSVLEKLFGILLLITGLREITWRAKKER